MWRQTVQLGSVKFFLICSQYPKVPPNLALILAMEATQLTLPIFRRPSSSLARWRVVLMYMPSAEALMVPSSCLIGTRDVCQLKFGSVYLQMYIIYSVYFILQYTDLINTIIVYCTVNVICFFCNAKRTPAACNQISCLFQYIWPRTKIFLLNSSAKDLIND